MQCVSVCDWLFDLALMFSSFTHVVALVGMPLLVKAEQYFVVCVYHILFICSSDGYMGCFYLFGIVNNAAMNVGIQISL